MLGKSRKHKSVGKHLSRKAKNVKKHKSVRHMRSRRNKRSRSHKSARKSSRKSARKSSRNYLGLMEGVDKFLSLDENVSRARNMGWGNWSGNAAEENDMRKELNETFLKPMVNNSKDDDEPQLYARELAHLQALRDKSNNKKSVVDDTEDIEDDIFYSMTNEVFDSFKHPTDELKSDAIMLEELKKTKKYNKDGKVNVDDFFRDVVKEADASSFFSSKKPRGTVTRASESAKRGVIKGAKKAGNYIAEKAADAGKAIAEGARSVGSAIASGVQSAVSALGDGCPSGSSIDYDYTLLNPVAQKEKNCYENCEMMEVNDGLYCMPSKTSRFSSNIDKGKNNPNPSKYNKNDPFTFEPRRIRKLTMKRQEL